MEYEERESEFDIEDEDKEKEETKGESLMTVCPGISLEVDLHRKSLRVSGQNPKHTLYNWRQIINK